MRNIRWINLILFSLGLLMVIGGLGGIWATGQTTTFRCIRLGSGLANCQQTHRFLGLVPISNQALQNVSSTEFLEFCSGTDCSYLIAIQGDQNAVYLTAEDNLDQTDALGLKQKIDNYLNDATQISFERDTSPAWLTLLLGGVPLLVLGGLVMRQYRKRLFIRP